MAIVKMKKLELYVMRPQAEALLSELMLLDCVEILEPDAPMDDGRAAPFLGRVSADFDIYDAQRTTILQALDILSTYDTAKSKLSKKRPAMGARAFFDPQGLNQAVQIAERLILLEGLLRRIGAEEAQCLGQIDSLRPWISMELPLDCDGTGHAAVVPGTVSALTSVQAMKSALADAVPEAQLYPVSATAEHQFLYIICHRDSLDALHCALLPFGFAASPLRGLSGTAAQRIREQEAKLDSFTKTRGDIVAEIRENIQNRDMLRLGADKLDTLAARAAAAEKLTHTESVAAFTGWMSAPEEKKVLETLSRFDCTWALSDPAPAEADQVPVRLKNVEISGKSYIGGGRRFAPLSIKTQFTDIIKGEK